MNLFGSCLCPSCTLETRFLLETKAADGFYLLGDVLPEPVSNEEIKGTVDCDYCQESFLLYAVQVDGVLSDFLNPLRYEAYKNGDIRILKAEKKAGIQKEKDQELTQFHESFTASFAEQPFEMGTVLPIGKHQWTVQAIYKKESVETDITKRLITPTLDEYWYSVQNEQGDKKWCIVTDTQYEHLYQSSTPKKSTLSSELKRVTGVDEWYEFQKEDETENEIEHNAILTIEPPFLKENEQKFDVSDSYFRTEFLFEQTLTANLTIKAYQYLAGVRFFVVNTEEELELDLFGESTEQLLDLLQEQLSISTEEY